MKKTMRTSTRQVTTDPADYDPMPGTGKTVDISGQRFGTFTAVSLLGSRKGNTYWLARCDCGAERAAALQSMRNGNENRRAPQCSRCYEKRRIANYISTLWNHRIHLDCEGWASREDFAADVGRERKPKTYLTKADHTAPWGPGNFRWTDKKPSGAPPQFLIGGKSVSQLAAERGVSRQRIFQTLEKYDPDTFEGELLSFGWPIRDVVRACREVGTSHSAMCARLRAGLSLDEAIISFTKPDRHVPPDRLPVAERNGAMDFPLGEVIAVRTDDPLGFCECLRAAASLRGAKVHTRHIDDVVMFRFKEKK